MTDHLDLDVETKAVDPALIRPHIECTRSRTDAFVQRECDAMLACGTEPTTVANMAAYQEKELAAVEWAQRQRQARAARRRAIQEVLRALALVVFVVTCAAAGGATVSLLTRLLT